MKAEYFETHRGSRMRVTRSLSQPHTHTHTQKRFLSSSLLLPCVHHPLRSSLAFRAYRAGGKEARRYERRLPRNGRGRKKEREGNRNEKGENERLVKKASLSLVRSYSDGKDVEKEEGRRNQRTVIRFRIRDAS